ncbi:tetratricopeptide repeat protein [Geomonas oryzae]|uniref:tetratricopeptide repeat protein n=1 Tax=Geomonas oryzae TaxID=2364273 RepID=UPI00100B5451|nr:tetratricopeptide repeat protein [Geomonas oryzae]
MKRQKLAGAADPAPETLYHRFRIPVHLLLMMLLGVAAYGNTLHSPFVLDDIPSIIDNETIRDLSRFLGGEGRAFNPRRVVGYFTFALNYRWGALDPFGYHLFNILIHVLTAWVLYFLLRVTLRTPFFGTGKTHRSLELLPIFAALLFVVHPVQTQAVTYIVQRLASLVTLFYLLTLFCYARGRVLLAPCGAGENGQRKPLVPFMYFAAALLFALLAVQTKEVAATLPLALLLYDFCFFEPSRKRNLLLVAGAALFVLAAAIVVVNAGKPLGELLSDVNELSRETVNISRADYLITQFSVIATYLRLLVLPVNQNLDYDYPVYHSLFAPQVFFSFLLLLGLFAVAVAQLRSSSVSGFGKGDPSDEDRQVKGELGRMIAFGILWFFLTLAVESSVIPISDVIFEHRVYLPAAGAFTALVAAILLGCRNLPTRAVVWGAALLVAVFAVVTWQRNTVWESQLSLWGDVIAKSPEKSRANNHYGVALSKEGRVPEAMEYLKKALQINPRNPVALYNLGRLLDETGNIDAAVSCYEAAVALQPELDAAYNNLAVDCLLKGDDSRAIDYYQVVLKRKPNFAEARNNLGFALLRNGKVDEAVAEFKTAISVHPGYAKAYSNLGEAYLAKGDLDAAIAQFQEAVRLKPEDAVAQENLARALQKRGGGR